MAYTLSHLLIGGFKAFNKIQRIPIKKITLLYGPNNSGKSSILHSLLYARRLRRDPNERSLELPWNPDNGSQSRLPGFSGLVHGNSPTKPIILGWRIENDNTDLFGSTIEQINRVNAHADFPLLDQRLFLDDKLFFDSLQNEDPYSCIAFPYTQPLKGLIRGFSQAYSQELLDLSTKCETYDDRFRDILKSLAAEISGKGACGRIYDATFSDYKSFTLIPGCFPLKPGVRSDFSDLTDLAMVPRGGFSLALFKAGNPAQAAKEAFSGSGASVLPTAWHNGTDFPLDVNDHFYGRIADYLATVFARFCHETSFQYEKILDQGVFLGPHRSVPEFLFRSTPPKSNSSTQQRNLHDDKHPDWAISERGIVYVNKWLQSHDQLNDSLRLELHDYVSTTPDAFPNAVSGAPVRVVLYDRKRKVRLGLQDVGQGISQALPILLASQLHSNDLVVEQPELHLHPRIQCELGDVFIDAVTREDYPLGHVICETHSEHLLLRLLRRIREGKLSVNDLSVVYVESRGKESVAMPMPVNESGELVRDWPGGFFEEGLREVLM